MGTQLIIELDILRHAFAVALLRGVLPAVRLLFFEGSKNASATALSWGRAVAEKDCFAPHFCSSSVSVAEVYCAPRSL